MEGILWLRKWRKGVEMEVVGDGGWKKIWKALCNDSWLGLNPVPALVRTTRKPQWK